MFERLAQLPILPKSTSNYGFLFAVFVYPETKSNAQLHKNIVLLQMQIQGLWVLVDDLWPLATVSFQLWSIHYSLLCTVCSFITVEN